MENSLFIVAPNRVDKENFYRKDSPACFGNSLTVGPLGNILAKASSDNEEILSAELDLEDMREAKRRYHFLRDWRPEAYDVYSRSGTAMSSVGLPKESPRAPETSPAPKRKR